MKTLSKLFGSEDKVKVMRLFLFNPDVYFFADQVATRSKVSEKAALAEIVSLENAGMVRSRSSVQVTEVKKRGKLIEVKKKTSCWQLDPSFEYLPQMQNLLINSRPLRKEEILKRLSNVGKLKMVIIAGVFIQDKESRVDILIVGDQLKRGVIDKIMKVMESEIGKELNYTSFETADFQYRLSMCDKLVRDILDYPHQKLLDKTGFKIEPRRA